MTVKSSYYFTLSQSVTASLNVYVFSANKSRNIYSTFHNSSHLALWTITDQSSNADSFWYLGGRKRTKFIISNRLLWTTVKRSISWNEATTFIHCRFWSSLTLVDLISAYPHSQIRKNKDASFVLKLVPKGVSGWRFWYNLSFVNRRLKQNKLPQNNFFVFCRER